MPSVTLSDYFCGDEEMRFTHFRIPRQLITHPQFKPLSADAKLLYGMLLNRMSLSAKNGWHDDTGRVYIYYTAKEVCAAIDCDRNKAMRLLAELDTGKGIGLIERVKQGQSKPDRIFCQADRCSGRYRGIQPRHCRVQFTGRFFRCKEQVYFPNSVAALRTGAACAYAPKAV